MASDITIELTEFKYSNLANYDLSTLTFSNYSGKALVVIIKMQKA